MENGSVLTIHELPIQTGHLKWEILILLEWLRKQNSSGSSLHKKYQIYDINALGPWPHMFYHRDSSTFTWFTVIPALYSSLHLITCLQLVVVFMFLFISLQVVLGPQNMLLQPFPGTNLISNSLTDYWHSIPNPSILNVWNILLNHRLQYSIIPHSFPSFWLFQLCYFRILSQ
jgi:hypothetical protein